MEKILGAVPAEWKFASEGDSMIVEGYGAHFNNVDSYGDLILPGAFAASLAKAQADGRSVPMLYQHQTDKVAGLWTHLAEDGKGLLAKGRLLPTTLGRDTYIEMKEKAITGLSIGFTTLDSSPRVNASDPRRTIKQVHLWEISPVTFPANDKARVTDVKSAAPQEIERVLRDAGLSRAEAKAFMADGFKGLVNLRDAGEPALDDLAALIRRNVQSLTL